MGYGYRDSVRLFIFVGSGLGRFELNRSSRTVRYYSEAWGAETTVGGVCYQPGGHPSKEGDGMCVGEMNRILQEAAMNVPGQRR